MDALCGTRAFQTQAHPGNFWACPLSERRRFRVWKETTSWVESSTTAHSFQRDGLWSFCQLVYRRIGWSLHQMLLQTRVDLYKSP